MITVPFDFSKNGGVHKVGGQDVTDEETEALYPLTLDQPEFQHRRQGGPVGT